MRPAWYLTAGCGAAAMLAAAALPAITEDNGCVLAAIGVAGAATIAALIARSLPGLRAFVTLVQAAAVVAALAAIGLSNPVPGGVAAVIPRAIAHVRASHAPMPPDAATTLVLAALIGLVAILTDVIVVGLRHAAWAAVPLSLPYLIPSLVLPWDTSPVVFAAVAGGFALVLALDVASRRTLTTRAGSLAGSSGAVAAAGVVVLALVASVGVGGILPLTQGSGLRLNVGPVQLTDPSIDLRKNLVQPADQTVLTYTTTIPGGAPLRLASLPSFTEKGWRLAQTEVRFGWLPGPPGLRSPGGRYETRISITGLASTWLPVPWAPVSHTAPGTWAFDPLSLTIMNAAQPAGSTQGLTYTVTSVDARPSTEALQAASAGKPDDGGLTLALPGDLPDEFARLAHDVTSGASTDGAKALALQAYFTSGVFTYSLRPGPGSGYSVLRTFLFQDREGYCEQFAGSMAMLARTLGIPSRVVVGFTAGTPVGDHYEVSVRQMHAWPELYFDNLGWVPFEPTPAAGSSPVQPSASASPSAAAPTAGPTAGAGTASERPVRDVDENAPGGANSRAWYPAAAAGLGATGLALLLVPHLLRSIARRRRLADRPNAGATLEGRWEEIRATCQDLGIAWPSASPRLVAAELTRGLSRQTADAWERLALALERSRYASGPADASGTAGTAELVRAELWQRATRAAKWRAWWRPDTVLRRFH